MNQLYVINRRLFLGLALLIFSTATFSQTPTEESIKKDLQARMDSLDRIEGIWVVSSIQQYYRYDTLYDVVKYPKGSRIAIVRKDDHFISYNLSGDAAEMEFITTEVEGVYIYKNHYKETDSYSKVNGVISKNGRMEINYEFPDKYLRYKLLDSYEEGTRVVNSTSWARVYPDEKKGKK